MNAVNNITIKKIKTEGELQKVTISTKDGRIYKAKFHSTKSLADKETQAVFLKRIESLIDLHQAISTVESEKPIYIESDKTNRVTVGTRTYDLNGLKKHYEDQRGATSSVDKQAKFQATIQAILKVSNLVGENIIDLNTGKGSKAEENPLEKLELKTKSTAIKNEVKPSIEPKHELDLSNAKKISEQRIKQAQKKPSSSSIKQLLDFIRSDNFKGLRDHEKKAYIQQAQTIALKFIEKPPIKIQLKMKFSEAQKAHYQNEFNKIRGTLQDMLLSTGVSSEHIDLIKQQQHEDNKPDATPVESSVVKIEKAPPPLSKEDQKTKDNLQKISHVLTQLNQSKLKNINFDKQGSLAPSDKNTADEVFEYMMDMIKEGKSKDLMTDDKKPRDLLLNLHQISGFNQFLLDNPSYENIYYKILFPGKNSDVVSQINDELLNINYELLKVNNIHVSSYIESLLLSFHQAVENSMVTLITKEGKEIKSAGLMKEFRKHPLVKAYLLTHSDKKTQLKEDIKHFTG